MEPVSSILANTAAKRRAREASIHLDRARSHSLTFMAAPSPDRILKAIEEVEKAAASLRAAKDAMESEELGKSGV